MNGNSGLTSKKELAEIRLNEFYEKYIPETDRDDFAQMSQQEKLEYLSKNRDTGIAVIILAKINNIDNELEFLNSGLRLIKGSAF